MVPPHKSFSAIALIAAKAVLRRVKSPVSRTIRRQRGTVRVQSCNRLYAPWNGSMNAPEWTARCSSASLHGSYPVPACRRKVGPSRC